MKSLSQKASESLCLYSWSIPTYQKSTKAICSLVFLSVCFVVYQLEELSGLYAFFLKYGCYCWAGSQTSGLTYTRLPPQTIVFLFLIFQDKDSVLPLVSNYRFNMSYLKCLTRGPAPGFCLMLGFLYMHRVLDMTGPKEG